MDKLIFNAVRYRWLKYSGQPGRLESVSLEVTHRCICRCRMCNIWKIPPTVADLPLSRWTGLLSSPSLRGLREIDITGGEPFLREDLARFIRWIGQAKACRFPGLKTIALTTNALLTDTVLSVVREVAGPLERQGIDLVLACGMDAVGALHDDIRRFKGAWSRLEATLTGLTGLRQRHPGLILGIKTTIIPANVPELMRIASFAEARGLFAIISPRIITPNRFGNADLAKALAFGPEDLAAIRRFYESPGPAWSGHGQTMKRFLETGRVQKPCSAGFNTLFVRHDGSVFLCPVIPCRLGNIETAGPGQLLTDKAAARFRKNIGKHPECLTCTEPGMERIAWPFEGLSCLSARIRMGKIAYERLERHMGFDKYW